MEHFSAGVQLDDGARYTLTISGEVDAAAAPTLGELVEACVSAGARELRFDMREVTFCDSTGVKLLIHAWRSSVRVVVLPSLPVRRVLDLTGVAGFVVIE